MGSSGRRRAPAALINTLRFATPVAGLYLVVAGFFYSRAEWHLEKARQIELTEYSEVIARLDKSLQFDQNNFESHQLRGSALMSFGLDFDIDVVRAGFMERAARSFERALELNEFDLFALVGLARCLDETGDPERAGELFERAIELGPWRREPHRRYGYHYLNRGMDMISENLVGAIELFELGKEEFVKSRQSNERVPYNRHEDPDLLAAGRYLSLAWEEHGKRLVDAAARFRQEGDAPQELAYLESARENFLRAAGEAPSRAGAGTELKDALDAVNARLKEIGTNAPQ